MDGLDLAPWVVALLVLAAFAAGWVDAVVGGGGLIQLPALLIGLPPDTPPATILGTNKISSVWGTATSSITYAIKIKPDWRTVLPLVISAAVGSALGAQLAKLLPREYFTPIVLVALIGVGIYTWRRPELGLINERKHDGRKHYGLTALIGLGVGAYDGILGPGTGSFFVILLVGVLGYGFLEASAKAKIANLFTNLAAIVVFAQAGSILWVLGLCHGSGQSGRRLPRCPDGDQPGQRLRPSGVLAGARRSGDQAGLRRFPTAGERRLAIASQHDNADQPVQPGQARIEAPQRRPVATVSAKAVNARPRSEPFVAAASQSPQNGARAISMVLIKRAAEAELRGSTARFVGGLGGGYGRAPGDQRRGERIQQDPLLAKSGHGHRLRAAVGQPADGQLVSVDDCVQLADELLGSFHVGELRQRDVRLRVCGPATGRVLRRAAA